MALKLQLHLRRPVAAFSFQARIDYYATGMPTRKGPKLAEYELAVASIVETYSGV